jgi:ABC-type transport system involved in multi-copper enzyme maturation permease subunit
MKNIVAAEWLKLWSLRSTAVLALGALFLAASSTVFLSGHVLLTPEGKASFDPSNIEFNTGVWSALMVGAACVGAVVMTGEYGSGLIRTTLVAVPSRGRVVTAKALALVAAAGALGVLITALTYGIAHTQLASSGVHASLPTSTLVRSLLAAAFALPLAAVIGLAFGAWIRHPAGACLAVVAFLALLPNLLRTQGRGIQADISNALPYHAWGALIAQVPDDNFHPLQPPTVAQSWVWMAVWPVAAVGLAVLALRRRDV